MLWNWFNRHDSRFASERFCQEHSRWLTHAMLSGNQYPRIPTRLVARGGFDTMMTRPRGPARAEQWWDGALERVDHAR